MKETKLTRSYWRNHNGIVTSRAEGNYYNAIFLVHSIFNFPDFSRVDGTCYNYQSFLNSFKGSHVLSTSQKLPSVSKSLRCKSWTDVQLPQYFPPLEVWFPRQNWPIKPRGELPAHWLEADQFSSMTLDRKYLAMATLPRDRGLVNSSNSQILKNQIP